MHDRSEKKKLRDAARHWASGDDPTAGDDSVARELRELGAPPEVIAQWERRAKGNAERARFAILEENQDAVRLFLASSTQWRTAGMGGVAIGLDYPGVESAARMMALAVTPTLFADLREMEHAAIKAMLEKRR
ncbi:DUF1799 domain-containing protein [Dongia deserti]|uniref:DUF1799 domain-containing protein n=1 Tax=Dongia deserti TaxID=2268030 RepID=UPI000E649D72|nr:DUF1799 domain-containing protein [Dongia deserti]